MVTLAVQASGTAIMATGMVLIIVSRNIDLSVGSIVGVVAMVYALLMTDWLPALGLGLDSPFQWIVALALGLGLGRLIGGFQGFIIAYVGVPSFIVTLGGLLSLRGSVWLLSSGAAVSGLHGNFRLHRRRRGRARSAGSLTWVLGVIGCLAIIALARQQPSAAAEVRLSACGRCGPRCCSASWAARSSSASSRSPTPTTGRPALPRSTRRSNGITEPPGGLKISAGFPWPIILVIAVTLVMTFIATRRRFGRYVYAYGGNPDAAELAGINTRWTIMKTFILMGVLCAIAAAISSARLNGSTLDVGSERRAVRHRRGRGRRHVVRRRHRHDSRRRAGRVRHAVARLRDELQRRQLARPRTWSPASCSSSPSASTRITVDGRRHMTAEAP